MGKVCRLETISYGHGITTTPIQAASAYAALTNGGYLVQPTLMKYKKIENKTRIIKESTSIKINNILRKVVTDEFGTASLANVFGYEVGGKLELLNITMIKIKILILLYLRFRSMKTNIYY